jgi:Flp pilus assembly protein TadD
MIARAVQARPDDAQIVDSMGWALYMGGDYTASISYLEKAVELVPGDPTVNDHLGDVYWRLGRKNEARFQWERALAFSPQNTLAQSIQKKLKDGLPPSSFVNSAAMSDEDSRHTETNATP